MTPTRFAPPSNPIVRLLVLSLLAVVVLVSVRSAVVRQALRTDRDMAVWPADPRLTLREALRSTDRALADNRPPDPATLSAFRAAAGMSPLAPEPLIAAAIDADSQGQSAVADALIDAAVHRDPRNQPGQYAAAMRAQKRGEDDKALEHLALFAKLRPGTSATIAPSLARLIANRRAIPALREIVHSNPTVGNDVLLELAKDRRNTAFLLAYQDGQPFRADDRVWSGRLVDSIFAEGDVRGAKRVWTLLFAVPGEGLLTNPELGSGGPPPPFNWSYANDANGNAQPVAVGSAQLLYHGRDRSTLMSQVLVLPPGRYRLGWASAGQTDPFSWQWTCLSGSGPTTGAALAAKAFEWTVPPTCKAGRLDLVGTPGEVEEPRTATVWAIALVKQP